MDESNIPGATAKRLPLYYRYLIFLDDAGKKTRIIGGISRSSTS